MSSGTTPEQQSYFVKLDECSKHTIFPGVDIATMPGQQMMISIVTFEPHSKVAPHQHPHEQVGVLVEGELTFNIGGQVQTLGPGEMWRIPGGIEHSVVSGAKPAKAIDIFHPIRDDYR